MGCRRDTLPRLLLDILQQLLDIVFINVEELAFQQRGVNIFPGDRNTSGTALDLTSSAASGCG